MERQIIIISGPTASGKTEFSISLAMKINTEIISADSRQFYKYLDIGTAKPNNEELKSVKHHLINFLNPNEYYNVSIFRKEVLRICEVLWNKGKTPVITGGSGLYIKAIIDGLAETPDSEQELRDKLLNELSAYGQEYLYNKLMIVDPVSASKMLPQNWKRVIRALEVFYLTGKPIWEYYTEKGQQNNFNTAQYYLDWPREVLYTRINLRVENMIEKGLIDEVKRVINAGFDKKSNSLNTVGYKEIILYLDGHISLVEAIDLIKRNTRRYAKRQITWFKKDDRIERLSIKSNEDLYIFAEKLAERLINDTRKQ